MFDVLISPFKDANTYTQEQCHVETTGKFAFYYLIALKRCRPGFVVHVSRAEPIKLVHDLML